MHRPNRAFRSAVGIALRWVDANPGHLMLAGGAARWVYDGCPRAYTPSDVDLFAYGHEHTPQIKDVKLNMPPGPNITLPPRYGGTYVTLDNPLVEHVECFGVTIQFILGGLYPDADAVLDSFDISAAMIGYTGSATVHTGKYFTSERDTIGYAEILPCGRFEERCKKYEDRGFKFKEYRMVTPSQRWFRWHYT